MINNLSNKFTYEEQKRRNLERFLRMLQRGEPMPAGFKGAPTPTFGNDSGGNAPSPMGQYVPGYPTNKPPLYYDGKMIKGGRKRRR